MTKIDRTAARARKAFAHAVAYRLEQADAKASAKALSRANRGERHARRTYVEALRLADLAEA